MEFEWKKQTDLNCYLKASHLPTENNFQKKVWNAIIIVWPSKYTFVKKMWYISAFLYNFKLVAIISGEYESFVSLINATGEIVTLQMNEELSPGVKLIGLNPGRAVFEKGPDSYLVINFKNQIQETSEPF